MQHHSISACVQITNVVPAMVTAAGVRRGNDAVQMVLDICSDFAPAALLSTNTDSTVPGRDYPMTQLSSEVRSEAVGG